jgi:hypothetical protein
MRFIQGGVNTRFIWLNASQNTGILSHSNIFENKANMFSPDLTGLIRIVLSDWRLKLHVGFIVIEFYF